MRPTREMDNRMLNTTELRAFVIETIVALAPGAERASIFDDTSLLQLGIGSLALFHFVITLERKLEISIPDSEALCLELQDDG